MKHSLTALTALCYVLCLSIAPRAEAGGGGRSIRIDAENGAGCMSTYNTVATATNTATSPDGAFDPGSGTFANVTECTSVGSTFADLFPDGVANGADNGASPIVATSATMYQFFSGAINSGSSANFPVTQVAVWDLGPTETEIELNGWCTAGPTASFKFDGNTFAGGCSASSANDLLFNAAGKVIGYVSVDSSDVIHVNSLTGTLAGWTENGNAITGGTVSAPEIDASSSAAALTLLIGVLAVLRGGRRALVPVR
jgi:hypothetical protein